MSKKLIAAIVVIFVLLGIGLTIWAKAVLTGERVRGAIARQISDAIGQPVEIGELSASVFPRVTVDLGNVRIGDPTSIQLDSVHLGADLAALFSREIQHADIVVDGADLTLPLPPFALGAAGAAASEDAGGQAPVDIVSVDTITLENVRLTSGGRTLTGDVELIPENGGVRLQRVQLSADGTDVDLSGAITNFSPLEGQIEARSDEVDFDALMAFLGDFSSNATVANASPGGAAVAAADQGPATVGRLGFTLILGTARTGGLELTDVNAKAVATPGQVHLEPMSFGIFGGRYAGAMTLALGDTPRFEWNAAVTDINAGQLLAFAGSPDALTGTLSGTVTLKGTGLAMEQALRSANGAARIDVADGTVQGLSLVHTAVLASSGREGGLVSSATRTLTKSGDEDGGSDAFERLGATLLVENGMLKTNDLQFESPDADLSASGTLTLQTLQADFSGQVQLSEELSKQAGTDLYRYSQEDGRVTLPATVKGPLGDLSVMVDVQAAAKRAITNKATEEAKKALERNLPDKLKSLFKKKPPK
ncbi:MAG: AsmA family protein [Vicinamibacterales bacterium]